MGVVQSGRDCRRGGVRIEYIIAAVVCIALLVAMTAVLLSVSDRKAKRELVRQPNREAPTIQISGPEEVVTAPNPKPSSAATPEAPVVVVETPKPASSTKTPDRPVVVTVTPETAPANSTEKPVVVTITPSPAPAPSPTPETPVVVTVTPETNTTGAAETPVVVVPSAPAPSAPSAAEVGAEIAADPLDTLKIGGRPVGNNWVFGGNGGGTSIQQSPQETSRCLRLTDTSRSDSVWAIRKFPSQAQQVGFECRFRVGVAADGYALAILGSDKPAVLLLTRNGELVCETGSNEWHSLQPYSANVWYTIRIAADVKTKTFNVFVDGVQRGEKLKFRNPVQAADAWQAETPVRLSGTMFLNAMKVTER